MTSRLQEFTGINPLTINQTDLIEKSVDSLAHGFYQQLKLKEPTVFVNEAGQSLKSDRDSDWFAIMLFYLWTNWRDGRPDGLFRNGKQPVALNL